MKRCDICGKSFHTAQALRGHQRLTHYGIQEQEAKEIVEENRELSRVIEEQDEKILKLQGQMQQLQNAIQQSKCPDCGKIAIGRVGFGLASIEMSKGCCSGCGTAIPGVWES